MKKNVLATVSLAAALFFWWSLSGILSGWIGVVLPMLVLIFWLWRLDANQSFWLVFPAGLVWDTFSILPFGTYLITLFLMILFSEFLKKIFSDTKALPSRIVSMPIMLVLFFGFSQLTQLILNVYV